MLYRMDRNPDWNVFLNMVAETGVERAVRRRAHAGGWRCAAGETLDVEAVKSREKKSVFVAVTGGILCKMIGWLRLV